MVEGQRGSFDWCGGVFASALGELGSYLHHGGGHNAYAGNEVYRFDVATRTWSRMSEPHTPLFNNGGYLSSSIGAGHVNGYGEFWTDGTFTDTLPNQPAPGHTYDHGLYLPPGVGGVGSKGAMLQTHIVSTPRVSGTGNLTHAFDLETAKWSRFSTNVNPVGSYGSACLFESRSKVYCMRNGPWNTLGVLDLTTRLWSVMYLTDYPDQSLGGNLRACEALGLLMFWRGYDPPAIDPFYVIHPVTGKVYYPGTTQPAPMGNGGGEWVEEFGAKGQFIYYDGQGGNTVWRLTPSANPIVAPWVWTSEEVTGPAAYVQRGRSLAHYSRFRWVPSRKVFLWVSDSINPVQAWRLQGT